jgi:hypothetical protein
MTTIISAAAGPSPAASIAAVAIAFVGALATTIVGVLNYRNQRRSLASQKETRDKEMSLLRSAQATDRFQRAIEQLGSQSPHIRMGGIFALERMARDPELPNDRAHIIDTLAAFVRLRLPAAAVGTGGYVPDLQVRAPDAQAALAVLCYPPLSDARVASDESGLSLARTDLRRAGLRGARLDRVNLYGARLEGADLREAHLEGSTLDKANFGRFEQTNDLYRHGADLRGANLTGARGLEGAFHLDLALTEGAAGLR